jgi:hypothetical protein
MLNGNSFDWRSDRLFLRFVGFPRAALATLRALPRLAEFPLLRFARLCTFDAFLRLAMIAPCSGRCSATHYAADANVRIYVADQIGMMLHRSSGENRCRPWSKKTAANWPL